MKKFLYILILLLIFIFTCFSFASAETYESNISEDKIMIKTTKDDGVVEAKSISIKEFDGNSYFGIRDMSNACGASIEWVAETKSIQVICRDSRMLFQYNSSEIFVNGTLFDFSVPVLIVDGTSYAPLDIYKIFTNEMTQNNLSSEITEVNSNSSGIEMFSIQSGNESDRITFNTNPAKISNYFKLSNPARIVVDLKDINFSGTLPEGITFSNIRYSINNDGITRFVFDLNEDFQYQINANGNNFILDISKNGQFISENTGVEFKNNSVILNTGSYEGYKVSRTTDPFAINIFIPDNFIGNVFEVMGDGVLVEKIIALPVENGAEISIITSSQCAFELDKLENNFIIEIYEPVVKNLEYHSNDTIPYITLFGLQISDSDKPDFKNNSDGTTITLNDSEGKITAGQVYINDDFINSIFVTNNNGKTIIRIDSDKTYYPGFKREGEATLLFLNEIDLSGKLVVISAGHGGRDPGAVVGDIHEAEINLSIALKLNDNLKQLGIDTLMIRTDDTYYTLDERVDIANTNNAALFISIHSNSLDDSDFDGLMTLVHSGSLNYNKINGRTAGEIMHKILIEETEATDRGVRFRDKIIVLKDTAMPAVEIEAGFLTNAAELSKLISDTYQALIAEASAKGIVEVLKLID